MEISPDGKTLKPRSRFSKFVNLPELQIMFRSFADVQTAEMLKLPKPKLETGKPIVVACPMSDDQADIQNELVERYERIRSTRVDPREDNALKITTDGRKLALDARMLKATTPECRHSKLNAMIAEVVKRWQKTTPQRGTQMIFCDLGVNPTPWGYSIYQDIIDKLAARGIPRSEIATIGEADSDVKKRAMFDKVRSGQIRILIGSTEKMGTGTNVQKRLGALHELDAPWRPDQVEQREGRILRQGNENEEVAVYRYVTAGSFDAFLWQVLETKARFINQVMKGDNNLRRADDIGSQEFDYATVKSIASGNPAFLVLAETDAEVQRLNILKRSHADEQYVVRRNLKELPERIDRLKKRLAGYRADAATLKANHDIIIDGHRINPDYAVAALAEKMESLPERVTQGQRVLLGKYRGLRFGMVLTPYSAPAVYLEGDTVRSDMLSREHHGPRAVMNAVERLCGSYSYANEDTQRELSLAQSQHRDFVVRQGKVFPHDWYLDELTSLRDSLKTALSANQQPEGAPSVTDLTEQIMRLRNENEVEAAPERTAKPTVAAEVPVTKRILNCPKVEIEVQGVNGEVGARMVDRIKRMAERAR